MAFWSSEKIKAQAKVLRNFIEPYDPAHVVCAAYELAVGDQVFDTSYPEKTRKLLEPNEQISISPGQFALLITDEKITIPDTAIGFISIRAGVKFRGLVNVSGFHVDPGFSGKLKFSVFNAGSRNIVLRRGERIFLLWFCNLDQQTVETYSKEGPTEITSEDVMKIQGDVYSPQALKGHLDSLKSQTKSDIESLRSQTKSDTDSLSTHLRVTQGFFIALVLIAAKPIIETWFKPSEKPAPAATTIPSGSQVLQNTNIPGRSPVPLSSVSPKRSTQGEGKGGTQ